MAETYDVVVIGSGPGGYVAAIRAAQLGLKTACIEKEKLGGTCLNVGCIPSKALLHSSHMYAQMQHEGKENGIEANGMKFNFAQMMKRKEGIVKGFNQGIAGLFRKNKVTEIKGTARLSRPNTIEVSSSKGMETVEAKNIILATGSQPIELPFLPFDEERVVSSTGALSLKKVPKRLVLIGGGVIGVELASVYKRLGAEVTVIEMLDRICPGMDKAISDGMLKVLKKQGLDFHLGAKLTEAKVGKKDIALTVEEKGSTSTFKADVVLVAVGRRPYTEGLGLEELGIQKESNGMIAVDDQYRTSVPHIFAIGDLVPGPMLAHKASEEGTAVAEIIAGHHPKVNYIAIPGVIYTFPEAASVGLSEEEAKEAGFSVKAATFPFMANSRARCVDDSDGFVKLVADAASGRLLGMHIIGSAAGEMIHEGMLALQAKSTIEELAVAPHAHPTLSEAIKEAALGIHAKMIHM